MVDRIGGGHVAKACFHGCARRPVDQSDARAVFQNEPCQFQHFPARVVSPE